VSDKDSSFARMFREDIIGTIALLLYPVP